MFDLHDALGYQKSSEKQWIPRTLASTLKDVSRQYPVVSLTGPRQSGKTTLARMVLSEHAYVSLEDPDLRDFARDDPRGFLKQLSGPVILDEVQRVPDLFSYIQTAVDDDDTPGRFILTGSQNFLLLSAISQSLAGRCAILHLLPFSLSELARREPLPLSDLGHKLPAGRPEAPMELMETLFKGFYPRIHDKRLNPGRWLRGYYQTYVERDVREIVNVGNIETFGRFIRLCAGRTGELLNLTSLSADCGITHTTARRWLAILEASFLITILRPYHKNFSKRLIKSPKLYFLDTGLLCYLLRIRSAEDLWFHASRGAIFESFVFAELLKSYHHHGEEPDIFFWRDSARREIDFVLDHGKVPVPVEVKSGQTLAGDAFKGLHFWRQLVGDPDAPAALVYGGERLYCRHGIMVYSWSLL
jgi:predicted AAA+ superfamily ATPase